MTAAHFERMPGTPPVTPPPPPRGVPARKLRLVAPLPRPTPGRRDAAYAGVLAGILLVGTLTVLLLNTVMQQQARTIEAQRSALAAIALQTQVLQLQLDAADNPRELARRAAALHMRPATLLAPLTPLKPLKPAPRHAAKAPVSAPARAASPSHAG